MITVTIRLNKWFSIALSVVMVLILLLTPGCGKSERVVVVYTSVDQVFSEVIFAMFEARTGIEVKAVYDIEASKTIGLANRLIEEKDNPQADVFWNGEILQTLNLKENGVLAKTDFAADIAATASLPEAFVDPDGYWYAFGGRARVILYNKMMISADDLPGRFAELPFHPRIREAGIANPVFGTTSTHAAALYSQWDDDAAKAFFQSLKDSGISILAGNSDVKDYVSKGKLAFGLTDTDDAFEAMADNPDLSITLLDQGDGSPGVLVIPNSVAVINGAPHKTEAEEFIKFILSLDAQQACVDMGWIHIPIHKDVIPPKEFISADIVIMQVDWINLFNKLATSTNDMRSIFIN